MNRTASPGRVLERPPTATPLLGEPGLWRATVVGRRGPEALDRLLEAVARR